MGRGDGVRLFHAEGRLEQGVQVRRPGSACEADDLGGGGHLGQSQPGQAGGREDCGDVLFGPGAVQGVDADLDPDR